MFPMYLMGMPPSPLTPPPPPPGHTYPKPTFHPQPFVVTIQFCGKCGDLIPDASIRGKHLGLEHQMTDPYGFCPYCGLHFETQITEPTATEHYAGSCKGT